MDHFQYHDGVLHAEDVSLVDAALRFGTPTYVYAQATLLRHLKVLQSALQSMPHLICYAIKANGNLAILQSLAQAGSGFDAVSVGELARALKAGAPPSQVILSGVGKRDDEIEQALAAGVLYICVESADELYAVAEIATKMQKVAPVSIRVNPDVDAKTHPYIATGMKENKFGVPMQDAEALYAWGQKHPALSMVGVTCHIGSQVTQLGPFEDAAHRMAALARKLLAQGLPLQHIGMGGGLGIPYNDETPPSPKAYGQALHRILADLNLKLILEPGRVLVGNAGILLSRVVRIKRNADRAFVLLDAGMNDLLRPALYSASHEVVPVMLESSPNAPQPSNAQASQRVMPGEKVDLVGPICESADTFVRDWSPSQPLAVGDLVALRSAGAYSFVMASTYNGRPRPAEVLCMGDRALCVGQRASLASLWQGEVLLDGSPADAGLADFDWAKVQQS